MIRLGAYQGVRLDEDPHVMDLKARLNDYLRLSRDDRAQRRAPIDESFFHSASIRRSVGQRCHDRCVFCEQPTDGDEFVDHFRPTRDALDLAGHASEDYYAWLAYEIDNLILVCRACAARKGTRFPVIGERAPYIAPLAEVRQTEDALLVDPYHNRVDLHFDFLVDGWCEPLTPQGRVTAKLLDLNRAALMTSRGEAIDAMLAELRRAIETRDGAAASSAFDVARPFVGARANIMARLLGGMTFGGRALPGSPGSRTRWFIASILTLLERDLDRLARRIDEVAADDRARARWNGEIDANEVEAAAEPRDGEQGFAGVPRRTGGIARVQIRDFKGIAELNLELRHRRDSKSAPCLMLLGENAVGKSSILQAIALAVLGGGQAKRLLRDPTAIFRNRDGERLDLLNPHDAEARVLFHYDGDEARFTLGSLARRIMGNQPPAAIVLGYGPRRFFDRNRLGRARGAYSRSQTLFSPTASLPYPGIWLNELSPTRFEQVAQIIRIVLALNDEDELARDLDGRISVRLGGKKVHLEALSEGYRSVFVMVADIARELLPFFPRLEDAEAIVLIDEIETHLHPRWKMRVMSSLRRAFPQVQFIVTTHDPLCLHGMDDGEVVVLERGPDGETHMLENLPSLQGMRADQLLTSDYFGLSSTVDPRTELGFARYVAGVAARPDGAAGEADDLIQRLTIGDDAREQVIQTAIQRYIDERERPMSSLRPMLREDAVAAVLAALKGDAPREAGQ